MTMVITDAKKQDIDGIMEIERSSFSVPWGESGMIFEIDSEDAYVPVLRDGGEILGFAVLHMFENEGELFNIAVKKEHRGKKAGKKLLISLIKFAERQRLERIFLEVRESTLPARGLYTKAGFRELGVRKNYYDHPKENAVMMVYDVREGKNR